MKVEMGEHNRAWTLARAIAAMVLCMATDRIGMVDRGIVAVTVEAKPSRQPTPALREAIRLLAAPSGG